MARTSANCAFRLSVAVLTNQSYQRLVTHADSPIKILPGRIKLLIIGKEKADCPNWISQMPFPSIVPPIKIIQSHMVIKYLNAEPLLPPPSELIARMLIPLIGMPTGSGKEMTQCEQMWNISSHNHITWSLGFKLSRLRITAIRLFKYKKRMIKDTI